MLRTTSDYEVTEYVNKPMLYTNTTLREAKRDSEDSGPLRVASAPPNPVHTAVGIPISYISQITLCLCTVSCTGGSYARVLPVCCDRIGSGFLHIAMANARLVHISFRFTDTVDYGLRLRARREP